MYIWVSQLTKLVGGLEHVSFFVRILGMSSSQVTNIVQRGRNHQPALICLSIYVRKFVDLFVNLSIYQSIYRFEFVYLSYLSMYLSIDLSIYLIVLNYILPIRSTCCYLYVMYVYVYIYVYIYIYSCVVI